MPGIIMKKLNIQIFTVIAMIHISTLCFGQESKTNPVFKGANTFGEYVEWLMNSGGCAPVEYCEKFIGFLQFKLDPSGAVIYNSIKISDNIQGCLRSNLRELLLSTHGQWKPMQEDGIAVESQTLLQIIYFRLEGACTIDDRYRSKDNLVDTFENSFIYQGEAFNSEPVIILPLATVYSSVGSPDIGDFKKKKN